MSTLERIPIFGKKLMLSQLPEGFKTTTDSILLSAACMIEGGQNVLDMGCGVGGAGLCLAARMNTIVLTGVDIQADHIEVAKQNAEHNQIDATFIEQDIRDYERKERFDHVICNPPYLDAGSYLISPSGQKATAKGHQDKAISVKDWIMAGHRNLKSGGSLTIIHRAEYIDKIIHTMAKRFGAIEVIPLWPKAGQDAKRVIVRGIKDRQTPARLHAGLVLHMEDGAYTDHADKILRGDAIIA